MKTLKQRLEERLKDVDPIILEIVLNPFLDETKSWLVQKRQEVTERRRNGEAFFGNQILNELLKELLDELKI